MPVWYIYMCQLLYLFLCRPENILITDSHKLKLGDFGLSQQFQGDEMLLTVDCGTPSFKAPGELTYMPYIQLVL